MLNHFLICDVEATSGNPLAAELLTGSFLYCDNELNVLDRYELESRPRVWDKDAEAAVAIHGITHAQAMRFTPFPNAIAELTAWLDTLVPAHFVAHANRTIFGKFTTYDYALLTTVLFDYGAHYSLYRAAPRKGIISTHSLAKYLNLPCELNLKAIATYLKVEAFNHHEAAADTRACYEILKILLPQVSLLDFFDHENFRIITEVENGKDDRRPGSRISTPNKRPTSRARRVSSSLI